MALYIAHYRSPNSGAERAKGTFVFESSARAGCKQNMHEARLAMLEEFGAEAVAWVITEIERKEAAAAEVSDGQLELDFREPIAEPKRKRRTVERGKV